MSFKIYCKTFLMAIIGVFIVAGAPCLIGIGGFFLSLPLWGLILCTLVAAFFSIFAFLKYIDKCSEPNSWFWKE